MATSTGAFFAGVATTFVVLAVGFGSGLMMARTALHESGGLQARAASEAPTPVRVILPNSAEPAMPPQRPQTASLPEPIVQPAKEVQTPGEKQGESLDTRKAEIEERERKRRSAERKAKRQAEARARQQRQQQQQQQPRERENAPIVAFGGDEAPRFGGGLFGN